MPGDDPQVIAVAEAIADGVAIDWRSAHRSATRDTTQTMRELQIIAALAAVHRRAAADDSGASLGDVLSAAPVTPPPASATSGMPWGPLIVLDKVGGGSFGTVYRAWDPTLDHEVALKRVRLPADTPRSHAASIVREGQLLARVRHENVITVHGACEIDGEVGIWMDFVRGKTLEQIIRDDGPMSGQEATVIGESLCRGLAAVHHAELLHRDIKAANVMREAGGRIVMLDFGTGTESSLENDADLERVAGTPLYMAPELFERGRASVQSDIYSLGVLLFHLVTGKYPVEGASLAQIHAAHLAGRRRLLPDLRADMRSNFVRTVDCALCPEPNDRFSSVGAMLRDLTAPDAAPAAPSPVPFVRVAGASVVGAAFAAMALGAVSTGAFNLALDRGEFATATPGEWFVVGVRSTLVTLILFTLGSIAVAFAMLLRLLLVQVSSHAARADRALMTRTRAALATLGLDDAPALASWLVATSASVLIAACWYFAPMLDAATSSVSTAPLERFKVFSPAFEAYQLSYRRVFEWLVILTGAAWYVVFRLARRRGQRVNPGLIVAGAATMFLALMVLDLPYRLIFDSTFRAAEWNGNQCYVTGENADDVLLFCPRLDAPRSRILHKQSETVRPLDTRGNIFSQAAPPIVTPRPHEPDAR